MDWGLLLHKWFGPRDSLTLVFYLVGGMIAVHFLLTLPHLKPLGNALCRVGGLLANSPPEEVHKWLKEMVDSGLLALGLVLFIIRPFILQAFYIPSGSMEPTLHGQTPPIPGRPNDRILVNKFIYWFRPPQRQDIIVFKAPPGASVDGDDNKDFIKRLIGLPGDTVEIRNGFVYINGQPLDEPYLPEENRPYYNYGPVVVPPNHYFVLGDNRNESNDSHEWGFLHKKYLIGKALFIFWPIQRWRILR